MVRIILAAVAAVAIAATANAAPKATAGKPAATNAVQCKDAKGRIHQVSGARRNGRCKFDGRGSGEENDRLIFDLHQALS